MDRIECVGCSKEIDGGAANCPQCGIPTWLRPLEGKSTSGRWSAMSGAARTALVLKVIASVIGFYWIAAMTIKPLIEDM